MPIPFTFEHIPQFLQYFGSHKCSRGPVASRSDQTSERDGGHGVRVEIVTRDQPRPGASDAPDPHESCSHADSDDHPLSFRVYLF